MKCYSKKIPAFLFCLASLNIIFIVVLLFGCSSLHRVSNVSPEHKDFLSKVRYIITKQEKKIFLNLPPEKREVFIEEFWKKRDPDPTTEINEFKEQYFQRIEEANHLFKEGGTPGWLQDRGRIYILLGPPEHREKYPTGYTFYGRPMEIWYYGPAYIIFIDSHYTGNYELYPLSAQFLAELLKAQLNLKPEVPDKQVVLDFKLKIEQFPENRIQFIIRIPYENIWFEEKDGLLVTKLRVKLNVYNEKKKNLWSLDKEYPLSIHQENIKEILGQKFHIIGETILNPGKYTLSIFLENTTDGQTVKKTARFTLKTKKTI